MKVEIISTLASLILANPILSQSISASYSLLTGSSWTGSEKPASYPSAYGVVSSSNSPGGRCYHKIAVYKNVVYTFHGDPLTRNDVWAYNMTSKTWAWVAGKSNSGAPSFGIRGAAASSNTPGYRKDFEGDIHRARGEFILFGGDYGAGFRSDLWTFNLATNLWTWLAGVSTLGESPFYGSIGISSGSTTPGARFTAGCTAYLSSGEFLVYGGYSEQSPSTGQFRSDMWAFNFSNLRWTWISGSSAANPSVSAGLRGEWSVGFYPSSRISADLALDTKTNIIYMFGGNGDPGLLNDIWAFKRDTLQWAWIGGSTLGNDGGNCGTMGYPGPYNTPGSRYGHNLVYHYESGLLIMFGGYGFSCIGGSGAFSDTWAFNTTSAQWTMIAGSAILDYVPANYYSMGNQFASDMAVDFDTSAICIFGGRAYVSQSVEANVDYLWLANITAPIVRSSSAANIVRSTALAISYLSSSTRKSSTIASTVVSSSSIRAFLASSSDMTFIASQFSNIAATKSSLFSRSLSSKFDLTISSSAGQINSSFLSRLWSWKYIILAAFFVVSLFVTICVASTLRSRSTKEVVVSKVSLPQSTFSGSFDGSTTFSSTGQTTLSISTMGVYLPGGLLVNGTLAYRKTKELAYGGGGSVWLATAFDHILKQYGDNVIVKIPNAKKMDERAVGLFQQEIALLNAFKKYQNIAKLLGYSENPYSTILKYYPNGSLSNWMSSALRTRRMSHAFIKDISCGILALHSNGVVHCDLKPDNVLIDSGTRLFAVITDFGISRIVTDKLLNVNAYQVQHIKGASLAYAAPEAIKELHQNFPARISPYETMARDIYAIGVILTALLNGKNAWR